MKISTYELLGMVKNGKALPKKVKVLDVIYEFDDHYGDYFNKELDRYLFVYMTSEEEWKLAYFLNAQVEILEEEKKIPEKLNWKPKESMAGQLTQKEQIEVIARRTEKLKKEFNEIIDFLKSKGE